MYKITYCAAYGECYHDKIHHHDIFRHASFYCVCCRFCFSQNYFLLTACSYRSNPSLLLSLYHMSNHFCAQIMYRGNTGRVGTFVFINVTLFQHHKHDIYTNIILLLSFITTCYDQLSYIWLVNFSHSYKSNTRALYMKNNGINILY